MLEYSARHRHLQITKVNYICRLLEEMNVVSTPQSSSTTAQTEPALQTQGSQEQRLVVWQDVVSQVKLKEILPDLKRVIRTLGPGTELAIVSQDLSLADSVQCLSQSAVRSLEGPILVDTLAPYGSWKTCTYSVQGGVAAQMDQELEAFVDRIPMWKKKGQPSEFIRFSHNGTGRVSKLLETANGNADDVTSLVRKEWSAHLWPTLYGSKDSGHRVSFNLDLQSWLDWGRDVHDAVEFLRNKTPSVSTSPTKMGTEDADPDGDGSVFEADWLSGGGGLGSCF